jgi:tubulin polyglutamylase TTLL1
MKEIAKDLIKSSFLFLDQDRHLNNFELFGLDFMVDYNFHPWLIEVNTNPCLELNCPLMQRILPFMVENTLRISLDPIFPPPSTVPHHHKYGISENAISYNKFSLIFDEERDGPEIEKNFLNNP